MLEEGEVKMKTRINIGRRNRTNTEKETAKNDIVALSVIKAMIHAYLMTGILLIVLSFLLYKFNLDEKKVAVGIILIYVFANFWGGLRIGKFMKHKKYLWGMILGILYVMLLLIITLGVYRTMNHQNIVTTLILCMCSGTIGGMIS